MGKDDFISWLENNTSIIPYSVNRYANAIDTLSSDLGNYGLEENNLFNVYDKTVIESILSNPEFQKKNNKGNRMYSSALRYFKVYIEHCKEKDQFQTELFKEEKDFDKYLTENTATAVINNRNIVDKMQEKPNYKTVNSKKIWIRNPRYASGSIADAKFLCEFNNQHQYFISKFNLQNYVEAHHLIPMEYQDLFDCSLDTYANIISLCLVCHKKIHFGLLEDKKNILDMLFNDRRERLLKSGINIEIEELYRYYQD